MLVEAQVSSMKISRSGSRSSWLSHQSCRRFRMSGRSCSLACADFFERDLVPIKEAPDPTDAGEHTLDLQSGLDLGQRDVAALGNDAQDRGAMALETVRTSVATQPSGAHIPLV